MNIYVVIGKTGEYADRQEWLVKAFSTKEKARKHARLCARDAKEFQKFREDEFKSPSNGYSVHDPYMVMDYTGTEYYYEEVEYEQD